MTIDRTESEVIEMFEQAVAEMVSIEQRRERVEIEIEEETNRQPVLQGQFDFGRLESLGTNTGCYRVLPATTEE